MKIKCIKSGAVAQRDPALDHIHLYKDEIIDVEDYIGEIAINAEFAVHFNEKLFVETYTQEEEITLDIKEEKMIDDNHKNKMFENTYKNKNNDRKKGKKGKKGL